MHVHGSANDDDDDDEGSNNAVPLETSTHYHARACSEQPLRLPQWAVGGSLYQKHLDWQPDDNML